MPDQKDNSSLPILLAISGAVFLVVAGGWFLFDEGPAFVSPPVAAPEITDEDAPPQMSDNLSDAATDIESATTEETATADADDDEGEDTDTAAESDAPIAAPEEPPKTDIDADLRKARLAADADILASPPDQSALFFYSRILAADPQHALAKAELAAVLSRIGQIVTGHLAAQRYDDAYDLAVLVARQQRGHPLVQDVQQTLDNLTEARVAEAMQHARDGEPEDAEAALAAAQTLPGRNPAYFAAVRDAIAEIQDNLVAAEQARIASDEAAATEATNAWVERVRDAIAAGQLISPAGNSAADFLDERETADEKAALTAELGAALVAAASADIDGGELDDADTMLDAAADYGGDDEEIAELRETLEGAYLAAESNRVLSMDDMVRINTVPARYPRRAQDRGLTGWVDVVFTVTADGETSDVAVAAAQPETVFDESAVEAVEQWVFEPRVFRGQPIDQRATARLVFRLQ